MSQFRKTHLQGDKVVVRDGNNRIVQSTTLVPAKDRRESLRQTARGMSDNGREVLLFIYDLAKGTPYVVTLPDGRVSEPIIPTPEVRLTAARDFLDRTFGKAVAQTEVVKAEMESVLQEQLAAMSNEDLLEAARPLLEAAQKRMELTDGGRSTEEIDGQTD